MSLIRIDADHIDYLSSTAKVKILGFNGKVARIERRISEMKAEEVMVSAMVEYLALHEKRATLVPLFY